MLQIIETMQQKAASTLLKPWLVIVWLPKQTLSVQSFNTLTKRQSRGAVRQYITERFDPVDSYKSPCSSVTRGTGPMPPQVCSELKLHYPGEGKG